MLMSKLFPGLAIILMFFLFYLLEASTMGLFGFYFLNFLGSFIPSLFLSFCLDYSGVLFLFMVLFVTSLVILYSEFYMDHYNFKKYSFLTLLFFLSMLFLSSSQSIMNFLMGWDGLGISSLCLIMFYPNKTTMYNSILTFFFNRLGDIFLLIILGFIFCGGSFFLYLSYKFTFIFLILLFICACTKGAQFPLSSWLPAAMSAPTPISAMVHSSTLVTAGIFIFWKFFYYFSYFYIDSLIMMVSLTTFLMGGFLANLDLDLKKIVAFSTMSQISMITFFLSLSYLMISMFHMFNHALFKTLIFCSCGFMFIYMSSDQFSLKLSRNIFVTRVSMTLFFSIFMMTGYQFSSSFFTKDLILESLNDLAFQSLFLLTCLGSVFTLFYCGFIMKNFLSPLFSLDTHFMNMKLNSTSFIGVMILGSAFLGFLGPKIFFHSVFPTVNMFMMLFILMVVLLPLFIPNFFYSSLNHLNFDLFYSKLFIFSKMGNFLEKDSYSFFSSDQMMFKPSNFLGSSKVALKTISIILIWILVLFFYLVF